MGLVDRSFADLWIWDRVGDRLPWYYAVSTNRMPAKYLIARRIPCNLDLKTSTEEALWAEHANLTEQFLTLWSAVRRGQTNLSDHSREKMSLVDLSVELVQRMLRHCNFCRWRCDVDRSAATKHGTCQLESASRVGSYFHHPGEELVFRGTRGSGTIFFTSCNLRCQFCSPSDTPILTSQGPREISDLYAEADDIVAHGGGTVGFPRDVVTITFDGRPTRVTKVFRHEFRGEMVVIEPAKGRPLWVTPEHEILSVGPDVVIRKTPAEKLIRSQRLVAPLKPGRLSYVRIRELSNAGHDGPVFNLEVEDASHTYTANGLAIGNCQNGDISHDKNNGIVVTPKQLAAMAWQLRMEGNHNINWVGGEPTIHLHSIVEAIGLLDGKAPDPRDLVHAQSAKSDLYDYRRRPDLAFYEGEFNVPMLWNSNFFMSDETMRILRPLIDVWLPDFKFGSDRCSIFLSRTPWYWETVTRNHQMVYDWGEDVLIRHLVMPDHVECCTKPVLRWIADHTPHALVNVMDQYHPDFACDPCSGQYDARYKSLARRPYEEEILEAYEYARELGLRFEDVTFEKARLVQPQWARLSG